MSTERGDAASVCLSLSLDSDAAYPEGWLPLHHSEAIWQAPTGTLTRTQCSTGYSTYYCGDTTGQRPLEGHPYYRRVRDLNRCCPARIVRSMRLSYFFAAIYPQSVHQKLGARASDRPVNCRHRKLTLALPACRGSCAAVQLAVDSRTGQRVAIKFIPRHRQTFASGLVLRELQNHKACSGHPHIVELRVRHLPSSTAACEQRLCPVAAHTPITSRWLPCVSHKGTNLPSQGAVRCDVLTPALLTRRRCSQRAPTWRS